MFRDSATMTFIKLLLAFSLGVGATVAATYNTFETQGNHDGDMGRIERQRQADRDELLDTLQRMEDKIDRLGQPRIRKMPEAPPEFDGYDNPPKAPRQAGG